MCAAPSHPMGRFPWDSHRNDIPMDMPEYSNNEKNQKAKKVYIENHGPKRDEQKQVLQWNIIFTQQYYFVLFPDNWQNYVYCIGINQYHLFVSQVTLAPRRKILPPVIFSEPLFQGKPMYRASPSKHPQHSSCSALVRTCPALLVRSTTWWCECRGCFRGRDVPRSFAPPQCPCAARRLPVGSEWWLARSRPRPWTVTKQKNKRVLLVVTERRITIGRGKLHRGLGSISTVVPEVATADERSKIRVEIRKQCIYALLCSTDVRRFCQTDCRQQQCWITASSIKVILRLVSRTRIPMGWDGALVPCSIPRNFTLYGKKFLK